MGLPKTRCTFAIDRATNATTNEQNLVKVVALGIGAHHISLWVALKHPINAGRVRPEGKAKRMQRCAHHSVNSNLTIHGTDVAAPMHQPMSLRRFERQNDMSQPTVRPRVRA